MIRVPSTGLCTGARAGTAIIRQLDSEGPSTPQAAAIPMAQPTGQLLPPTWPHARASRRHLAAATFACADSTTTRPLAQPNRLRARRGTQRPAEIGGERADGGGAATAGLAVDAKPYDNVRSVCDIGALLHAADAERYLRGTRPSNRRMRAARLRAPGRSFPVSFYTRRPHSRPPTLHAPRQASPPTRADRLPWFRAAFVHLAGVRDVTATCALAPAMQAQQVPSIAPPPPPRAGNGKWDM